MKILSSCLILLSFVVNVAAAEREGPPCLFDLCIGAAPVLEQVAHMRLHLPAPTQHQRSGIDYSCFAAAPGSYLKLGVLRPDGVVVSIGISSFDDCGGSSLGARGSIPQEVTGEGLRLGDSLQDVLRIYGSPERVVKQKDAFDRWLSERKRPPNYYQRSPLAQLFIYGPAARQGEFRVIGFDSNDRVNLLRIYAGP